MTTIHGLSYSCLLSFNFVFSSQSNTELHHITCFGQWDRSKIDINRGLKKHCFFMCPVLPLLRSPWEHNQPILLKECDRQVCEKHMEGRPEKNLNWNNPELGMWENHETSPQLAMWENPAETSKNCLSTLQLTTGLQWAQKTSSQPIDMWRIINAYFSQLLTSRAVWCTLLFWQ